MWNDNGAFIDQAHQLLLDSHENDPRYEVHQTDCTSGSPSTAQAWSSRASARSLIGKVAGKVVGGSHHKIRRSKDTITFRGGNIDRIHRCVSTKLNKLPISSRNFKVGHRCGIGIGFTHSWNHDGTRLRDAVTAAPRSHGVFVGVETAQDNLKIQTPTLV